MKILIVTGGTLNEEFARDYLQGKYFDHIIAADAGLASCEKIGIVPTELLGDFDSLKSLERKEHYKSTGIPVLEFPTRKDYTDTHLAISYALDLWGDRSKTEEEEGIWILGATGTRIDHTMANIGLLVPIAQRQIPCKIVDSHNEIEVLYGKITKEYSKKKDKPFFSLIALSDEVTGITLKGFSYPLIKAKLDAYVSLGISNEIVDKTGELSMESGILLVVRSND